METLTTRDKEALFWTANGRQPDEISLLMGISRKRVNNILYEIRQKMEAHTTAHAVAVAIKRGCITVEEIYDTQNPPEKAQWLNIVSKLLSVMVLLSGAWISQEEQELRPYRTRIRRKGKEELLVRSVV